MLRARIGMTDKIRHCFSHTTHSRLSRLQNRPQSPPRQAQGSVADLWWLAPRHHHLAQALAPVLTPLPSPVARHIPAHTNVTGGVRRDRSRQVLHDCCGLSDHICLLLATSHLHLLFSHDLVVLGSMPLVLFLGIRVEKRVR